MRKIFTLYLLLLSTACFSQQDGYVDCTGHWVKVPGTPAKELSVKTPDLTKGLAGKVSGLNVQTVNNGRPARMLSCRSNLDPNCKPLLVVNGELRRLDSLASINPNDIEKIEIIKGSVAMTLYGSQGYNGVIVVALKNSKLRKFIIKDFTDGSPVAGATVLFTSLNDMNDKIQFIANDSGIVIAKELNKVESYQITVSAVGYISAEQVCAYDAGKEKEILLNRDIKTGPDVIVSAISCSFRKKTLTCTLYCLTSGCTIVMEKKKQEQLSAVVHDLNIYPNPIQKGASINLQFGITDEKEKIVRVVSLDGKILLQRKINTAEGNNIFQLPADNNWSAGVYFVQLLYENGKLLASEKIIIY